MTDHVFGNVAELTGLCKQFGKSCKPTVAGVWIKASEWSEEELVAIDAQAATRLIRGEVEDILKADGG